MLKEIQTELPIWLASIGLVLAIFLSLWTYSGERARFLFTRPMRILLGMTRGLGFLLLFMLFLGILWKRQTEIVQKPVYLIGIDNSQSMLSNADTSFLQSQLDEFLKPALKTLAEKFELEVFTFGQGFRSGYPPDFSEPITNYGDLFTSLHQKYLNRPVQELLLVSDGISTAGRSLNTAASSFPGPVSLVGIGDTTRLLDLRIAEIICNDVVYLNSKFPVEVLVQADLLGALQLGVQLEQNGEVVTEGTLSLDSLDGKGSILLLVDANRTGNQVFDVILAPLSNETNIYNNRRTIAVEVVEKRNQALLVYETINPDIRVLDQALTETGRFDVTLWPLDQGIPDFTEFQVCLVYQIPSRFHNELTFLNPLLDSGINSLFIVGTESSLFGLQQLFSTLRFQTERNLLEDFNPLINENFSLFQLPENLGAFLKEMPPLRAPLSTIQVRNKSFVLFKQEIKGIELSDPLVWFMKTGNSKLGFWWGEGLWRWRLFEYLNFGDHFYTDNLIQSVVNYMTINEIEDPLKIEVPRTVSSFENLVWNARLYNESLELINEPDLFLDLTRPDGSLSKLEFRRLNGQYQYELGQLQPGVYQYRSYTELSGKVIQKSGQVEVLQTALEQLDTRARFDEMRGLAKRKGGAFFTLEDSDQLRSYIAQLEPESVSEMSQSTWFKLLNWYYLLFIIVFLYSVEWVLRRWAGTR